MTKDDLIAFENDIREEFNAGKIAAPIHLAGGNEDQIIEVFKEILPNDWLVGTWRSHFHCLLKGVPPAELKQKIMEGRSIALCFPQHKILCSAMVGGNAPLAVGIAWVIKQKKTQQKVWCFLGDMGAASGIARECMVYAHGHELPIEWIIEDNGVSVGADTKKTWGCAESRINERRYHYQITVPHVGTGQWSGL